VCFGIAGLAGVDLLERNYDKAAVSLRDLLFREPKNTSVLAMLARVLLESSRNAEAAEEARLAMALDPYNTEALQRPGLREVDRAQCRRSARSCVASCGA